MKEEEELRHELERQRYESSKVRCDRCGTRFVPLTYGEFSRMKQGLDFFKECGFTICEDCFIEWERKHDNSEGHKEEEWVIIISKFVNTIKVMLT